MAVAREARPVTPTPALVLLPDSLLALVKTRKARATLDLAVEVRHAPWALEKHPEIPEFPEIAGRDASPVLPGSQNPKLETRNPKPEA